MQKYAYFPDFLDFENGFQLSYYNSIQGKKTCISLAFLLKYRHDCIGYIRKTIRIVKGMTNVLLITLIHAYIHLPRYIFSTLSR